MKRLLASLSLLILASGPIAADQTKAVDVSSLSEASMNFDQSGVRPFLVELAGAFDSGFSSGDASRLAEAIGALPLEASGTWEYLVAINGRAERLVVVAHKDDVESPDLAFYSSPELASVIDKRLERFAESQGW